MSTFRAVAVHKLGFHRGACRLWLQGNKPALGGFLPQVRFSSIKDEAANKLTLKIDACGSRMVSRKATKKEGAYAPVIDLNQNEILGMFAGLEQVRVIYRNGEIIIQALESEMRTKERLERLQEKAANGAPLVIGSLSHGGGVLSKAIHDGLAQGGFASKLSFANDIREELLEHASQANPVWSESTIALSMPMQELAFDWNVMDSLPLVDILEAGIPCEGASLAGRSKNKTSCAEEHPLVGHLIASFIAVIAKVNPAVVVLENVTLYRATASMHILRNQLRDFGYEVHETQVSSDEWGTIEARKRFAMVAVTKGMSFNFEDLVAPYAGAPMISAILDDVPLDDPRWSSMDYLVQKAERDATEGKGFAMQIVTEDATKVGVLGKGYMKRRGTEPKLQHPVDQSLMRLFTGTEHCRLKGVDPVLVAGLSETTAHELLGQSITPIPFQAIARLVASSIHKLNQGVQTVCKLVAKSVNSGVQVASAMPLVKQQVTLSAQPSLF